MLINRYLTGPLRINTYLVVDEETKKGFAVDMGGFCQPLLDYVNENEIEIEYIVLTHGHGDHIGGVPEMKAALGCKVCIHEDDGEMAEKDSLNHASAMYGKPIEFKADLMVKEGDVLNIGSMELSFLHTPGHTPGCMCILLDNVLFSGDTLFQGSVGRTDFPYSSTRAMTDAIKQKLFVLPDDTVVLPGHEGQTSIGDEKRYNPFVRV